MTQADHTFPTVPIAQAGPVTDRALEELARIGRAAQMDRPLTEEGAQLILLCLPQIANELLHRRRAMQVIEDLASDNVVFLSPGAGDATG